MIVERFSKREVYSCENRQIFFKPVFGGARRRDLCPIGLTGSRIRHKTGKRNISQSCNISQTCNRSFQRWEESILKPRTPAPPEKFHAFAEKLLAQDNKTLSREGTKAEKAKKQIGKR